MPEEGFLRRWARRKTEIQEGRDLAPVPAPEPAVAGTVDAPLPAQAPERAEAALASAAPEPAPAPAPAPATALPTMEDVASLDADSDFSAFVARGVDQAVRRGALKKLFADPHFNVMDKLDIYIDDYTAASPVSAAMLASLSHAKSVFMRAAGDEEAVAAEAAPEAAPKAAHEAQIQKPTEQPPEQETQ
jgi:hypothetical protein